MTDLDQLSAFLLQFDALKSVNRRTYINGGERVENSAEHSWHLAIACWAFADLLQDEFDLLKLIKLALVHDLGEIDAGDTFLYSSLKCISLSLRKILIFTPGFSAKWIMPLLKDGWMRISYSS